MNGCPSNEELRRFESAELSGGELESLLGHLSQCPHCRMRLAEHPRGQKAIESPDADEPNELPFNHDDSPEHPTALPEIPGYTIKRIISRGGQGVVYLAIQASTQRKVAIKILPDGALTGEAAKQRFLREIEIVASMRHPNIVSIYDSGVTPDGIPYMVMDHIVGGTLKEHIEKHSATIDEHLRLFARVCDGVGHAHQRGIIHRDLKPGNILIESSGCPRIVDFGLARFAGMDRHPAVSIAGEILGTLPYLAPEQVRGDGVDVDVRTDVYALGVILYELIAGKHPYPVDGDVQTTLTNILESDPAPIRRANLDPDLWIIISKALSKPPDRRYENAGELGADIRSLLSGQPIAARRDSHWYVIRKLISRHRVPVVGGAMFVLLLIGWAVTQTVMYLREQRIADSLRMQQSEMIVQRDRALAAEAIATSRFESVREISTELLFDAYDQIETLPGATRARELVVRTATEHLEELAKDATDDATLKKDVASGFMRLGDVLGGIGSANLGESGPPIVMYRRAIDLLLESYGGAPTTAVEHNSLGGAYGRLALLQADNGNTAEAIQTAHQAADHYKQARDLEPGNLKMREGYSYSRRLLANVHNAAGLFQEMGRFSKQAVDIDREILADHPDDADVRAAFAYSCSNHAEFLAATGKIDEALSHHREAMREREILTAADPQNSQYRRNLSYSRGIVGSLLLNQGKFDEARVLLLQAMTLDQCAVDDDPSNAEAQRDLALSHQLLGNLELLQGNHDEAIVQYRGMYDIFKYLAHDRNQASSALRDLATATGKLSDAYLAKGDMTSAGNFAEQTVPILEQLLESDPANLSFKANLAAALGRHATILSDAGKPALALPIFRRASELVDDVVRAESTFRLARRNQAAATYQVALAYEAVAADDTRTPDERAADLHSAVSWYEKTITVYEGLHRDAMATDDEYDAIADLRDAIKRCRDGAEKLTRGEG